MNIKDKTVFSSITDSFFVLIAIMLLSYNHFSGYDISTFVIALAIISNLQLLYRSQNSLLIINLFLFTYWLALVPFLFMVSIIIFMTLTKHLS